MRRSSICIVLFLSASTALAGYRYEVKTETPGGKPLQRMVLTTQDGLLAVDMTEKGSTSPESSILWSGDAVTMVEHSKKRFTRMDEAAAEGISEQASGAMKEMDRAMAGMSQAQKDALQKMMRQRSGAMGMDPEKMKGLAVQPPAALSELALTATGESGSHNGVSCRWHEARRGEELTGKMCLARSGEFPGAAELSASTRAMSEFMMGLTRKMTESLGAMGGMGGLGQIPSSVQAWSFEQGFPVIAERYERGKVVEKTLLESAEEVAAVAPDVFQPPAGYEAQSLGPQARR